MNCYSQYTPTQNAQRCQRFCQNNNKNACANSIITYDCTPWDKKYWAVALQPTPIDPALYNWLNGCWMCNYYKQEQENQYLCNRSFYNGEIKAPCNAPNIIVPPINSADQLAKKYK